MNFTPTAYKSSAPQNLHNLLSSSLYNSSSLLTQDYSGTSPSLSTPETSTPSPLLDTFGLSQDPFLDTPQHDKNQPQLPLAGSSSWNRIQPLARTQSGYMHPSDQMQSLLEDNERLRQENLMLAIGKAAIESTSEAHLRHYKLTRNPTDSPVDQSKLQFFTLTQFNAWLKCADANMKERGQLPFLEDANGKPLSREKKAAICQSMRDLWRGFKHKDQAPLQWKKGNPDVQEIFRKEMVAKHPELALCADNWKIDYIATERYPSWASTYLKDLKAAAKSKAIKSEPCSVGSENNKNELAPKKRSLSTVLSSGDENDSQLVDSPLLSKKPKLDHATLETPISLTPPSPEIATKSDQLESPHDAVNVISTSTTPTVIHADSPVTSKDDSSLDAKSTTIATFPIIKNPLDALHSKSIVRPLPRMIPSAMTTTSHTDTSPSVPSPTESTPGSSNNALPAIPTSDDTIPSPIPSAPTTNVKRMRPGPNKNGRTLCAHRWLNAVAKDAGGTTADFKAYWTALPKDAKQRYDVEAAQLVASGVWNANSADVIAKVSTGVVH